MVVFKMYHDHIEVERRQANDLQVIRSVLNRMIENQRMFVPVIDKMASVAQDIWESRETRVQVMASHERQEAALERLLASLPDR